MKTKEEIEQLAENIYREFPNNPIDKEDWHYNKDNNCHRKRKAFIKGYTQCQEQMADKKYTEEDMLFAFVHGGTKFEENKDADTLAKNFKELINSLNKQD
jgi:hypothetical protein